MPISDKAVYYKPSGLYYGAGLLMLPIIAMAASSVLAYAYAYISWFMPVAQLNAILPFLWGILVAALAGLAIKKFHMRAPFICSFMVCLFSLTGLYMAWVFHSAIFWRLVEALLMTPGSIPGDDLTNLAAFKIAFFQQSPEAVYNLAVHPTQILDLMKKFYQDGSIWVLGKNGSPWHGPALALVWIGEALAFLSMAACFTWSKAKKPYSEKSGRWLQERIQPQRALAPDDMNAFSKALKNNGDVSWLLEAPVAFKPKPVDKRTPLKYLTLTIFGDNPMDDHYLSVKLTTQVGRKIKHKKLVEHLKVRSAEAVELIDRYALPAMAGSRAALTPQ